MASDDSLPTLKILLIGPSGAGKSARTVPPAPPPRGEETKDSRRPPAVLIRYCDDLFDSESSTATIGVDFKLKKMSVRGTPYRLNLLDTAGQERFRTLSNSYYRGAHGVILVYDISNRESFLAMDHWFREAEENAMPGVVTYLVGSKLDKAASRSVRVEEGEALAQRHGASFCEVSAKTRENVRRPFIELVNQIVSNPQLVNASKRTERGTVSVGEDSSGFGAPCSC